MQKKAEVFSELKETFKDKKLMYLNLVNQPTYVDDLRLFKKPKMIKRELERLGRVLTEETKLTYLKVQNIVFILQIEVDEQVLHQELTRLINIQRLRGFATEKCTSISMEFREVTDEMDLIKDKFTPDLIQSMSKRVTKLYLNFGQIKQIRFLHLLPNLKVLFIRKN